MIHFLPSEIQWFPPGRRTTGVLIGRDAAGGLAYRYCAAAPGERIEDQAGLGWELAAGWEIDCTPETAEFLNEQLRNLRAVCAAGGQFPFGDYEHRNDRVVFEALEFHWDGSDPAKGGVRLSIRWTEEGLRIASQMPHIELSPEIRFCDAPHGTVHHRLLIGPCVGSIVRKTVMGNAPIKREHQALKMPQDDLAGVGPRDRCQRPHPEALPRNAAVIEGAGDL